MTSLIRWPGLLTSTPSRCLTLQGQKLVRPGCCRSFIAAQRCFATSSGGDGKREEAVQHFDQPEAYLSLSTSPLFNLSFEEHLLRSKPADQPVCFIYRNDPCIVLGRNQNQWKELNIEEMRKRDLRLVKRRSGGGAVFHDLGNTNFSFHVPRATFARRTHAELIARALNGPDVGLRTTPADGSIAPASGSTLGHGSPEGVYVNDRNDLCVKVAAKDTPSECRIWSERKISGSAFKILSHRAYHHGTMLLSSDLSLLGSSLRSSAKSQGIVSKGVDSVRSKVTNLSDAYPSAAKEGLLTHDSFVKAVVREFWRTYSHAGREGDPVTSAVGAGQEEADAVPLAIEVDEKYALAQESKRVKLEEELGIWDWIFGQCPEFEVDISTDRASTAIKDSLFDDAVLDQAQVWLRVKNGVIQDVEIKSFTGDESCKERLEGLKGTRYDDWTDRPPLPVGAEVREEEQGSRRKEGDSIDRWLREAL